MAGTWWYYEISNCKVIQRNDLLRFKKNRVKAEGSICKSRHHYSPGKILTREEMKTLVNLTKKMDIQYLFISMNKDVDGYEIEEVWLNKTQLDEKMTSRSPNEYQNYLKWIKTATTGDLFMFDRGWIVANRKEVTYTNGIEPCQK